jgi:hypothetical protein
VLSVGFSTLSKNLQRSWGKWGKLFLWPEATCRWLTSELAGGDGPQIEAL